jgi:hypothetical protein
MKYLLIALSLLVVGCDIDNPGLWEYQVCVPKDTSPQDLVAIESCLMSNGYKRVKIAYSYFDGNVIYATRNDRKKAR